MISSLNGMRVIVSPSADRFERFQSIFPRSKKKRIAKKFTNDMRNYSNRMLDEMLQVGDTLVVGPLTMEKLEAAIGLAKKEPPFHLVA